MATRPMAVVAGSGLTSHSVSIAIKAMLEIISNYSITLLAHTSLHTDTCSILNQ